MEREKQLGPTGEHRLSYPAQRVAPGKVTRTGRLQSLPLRSQASVDKRSTSGPSPASTRSGPDEIGRDECRAGEGDLLDHDDDLLHAGPHEPGMASAPPANRAPSQSEAGAQAADSTPQHVELAAGELLHVVVSANDPVELVLQSRSGGVVARSRGHVLRATHLALVSEPVRIEVQPLPGQARLGERPLPVS